MRRSFLRPATPKDPDQCGQFAGRLRSHWLLILAVTVLSFSPLANPHTGLKSGNRAECIEPLIGPQPRKLNKKSKDQPADKVLFAAICSTPRISASTIAGSEAEC